MAMGSSFTNLDKALTVRYDRDFRGKVGWSKGKLAAMVAKTAWSGKNAIIPLRVGNSPARSADFATARAKAATARTKVENFTVSYVKEYGISKIEGLLMDAASDEEGRLFDEMCAQIDGQNDAVMHAFSQKIYRNGFGAIGVLDATTNVATAIGILQKREDLMLFEIDQDVVFSASDHGAVLRNAGAVLSVTALNDDGVTATVTFNANINTVTGTLAGDTIFPAGDRQNSATPSMLCIPGLDAWLLPATALDFTGVNRSTDLRLQGTLIDATAGMDEEAALIAAAIETSRYGGQPQRAFFNPTRYQSLVNKAQARLRPTVVEGPGKIGISGVELMTSWGAIKVFSDPYCPVRRAYVLDPETFKYYGVKSAEIPRFLNHDKAGNVLRLSDDDGVEARCGYYGTTGMNAPIKNAVIKFEAGA
ncbi:MAG TPA: hypothetical protein VMS92_21700 [Mycobacterium sp.]|nr:hypothetical protein [Mycobacterium sp.]